MEKPSTKLEVLWSPNNPEEFAAFSKELKLYTFKKLESPEAVIPSSDLKLDQRHYGKLIGAGSSEVQCTAHQCVAWQVNQRNRYCFAVGQNSGKVILTNISPNGGSLVTLQQLSPRNNRPCLCTAWSTSETDLLAVGLDKARNDSSLIVWDTTRAPSERGTQESSDDNAKCFEIGQGEATSAIAWSPLNPSYCLIAAMGNKYLRLFDIRDKHPSAGLTQPQEYVSHKGLSSLCFDPSTPHQLATHADGNTVFIWDIRHFSKPMYSFSRNGTFARLSWMPTRHGCLSAIMTESPFLRLIDIPLFMQSSDTQGDMGELYYEHLAHHLTDRCPYLQTHFQPYAKLSCVAWHPQWGNLGIVANMNGTLNVLQAYDKTPLSWTGSDSLMFGRSSHICASKAEGYSKLEEDISSKMQARVKAGYGFDVEANIRLVEGEPALMEVWKWMQLHGEIAAKGLIPADKPLRSLSGVCSVLNKQRTTSEGSKKVSALDRSEETLPFPIYCSSGRTEAMLLCGWSFVTQGNSLEDYLKREELSCNHERAAAIAVFQGHIRRAIVCLKDGADAALHHGNQTKASLYSLLALALSGYTCKDSKLWQDTYTSMKAQIRSPYLSCALSFLCCSLHDSFGDVLSMTQPDMSYQDCVAFACMYLDDSQLLTYISELTKKLVAQGKINGLFLTGLPDEDGVTLMTNYVNLTGDVQTACLVAGQVLPSMIKTKVVSSWFQGYKDLLDQWQLWSYRAHFEGEAKRRDPTLKPPKQASVVCNFCGKSLITDSGQERRMGHGVGATGRKVTSCPGCRKPLPRCALCLVNMVATTAASKGVTNQFGQWFTWCQSCRHGGHATHIDQWFSTHTECPVTGCSCHCFALDSC